MSTNIFGYTWEEIKQAQQGKTTLHKPIQYTNKPTASQSDIDLLNNKGIDYIMGNGLAGVIDRLTTSGLM